MVPTPPTRLPPEKSPFGSRQHTISCGCDKWISRLTDFRAGPVHRLGDFFRRMPSQILTKSFSVNSTAAALAAACQSLSAIKDLIGNGNSRFHTWSITSPLRDRQDCPNPSQPSHRLGAGLTAILSPGPRSRCPGSVRVSASQDQPMAAPPKPLVLVILDGWGYAPPSAANAISLARKPNYDRLLAEYPNTLIHTSGRYVGLPTGQMGNSEVGHLNIGAGRVVYMDITKIDLMIEKGEFSQNPVLLDAMTKARIGERRLHLFGLLSDGGVHSHQNHLYAHPAHGQAERRGARLRPLLYGWPRHAAHQRRRLHRAAAAEDARVRRRQDRHGQRPLLRDGSRPPLGAREEGLRRHGRRRRRGRPLHRSGPGREGLLQPRRDRRIHHPVCPDRRAWRRHRQHSRWRCLHQLQLPRRPRPPDHALSRPQQSLHRRRMAASWKAPTISTTLSHAAACRRICTTSA